jgi:hypothetical protein
VCQGSEQRGSSSEPAGVATDGRQVAGTLRSETARRFAR